jgi:hypothetical protein
MATPPVAAKTFTLSSLMLVIALIAACLGVIREAPGVGIGLAIVITPALVRAGITAKRREAAGRPISAGEKIGAFCGSVGVVSTIGIAAAVTFYATCWAGFFGGAAVGSAFESGRGYGAIGWGLAVGVGVGIVAGLFVLVRLARRLWPRKD